MSNNQQYKEHLEKAQQNFQSNDEGGGGGQQRNQIGQQVGGKARNNQQAQIDQFQRFLNSQGGEQYYSRQKRKPQGQGKTIENLIKRIFQSTAKFEEFNKLCQQQKRSICSNMIGKSDLYFQCFDCNKENQDTILCQSCFVKGSHTYHKVVYFNDMDDGGQCDCGDASQKYPTFCEDHPVKKKETEHEKQRMLALISPEIREKITEYFEQEFIKVFKALDTAKSGQCFSISQDIFQLLNNMIYLMNNRVPMIYLISDLLTKHLDFQPASYEKHIQDQIITINQSPYPSFLSKNKKTSKKKRQSKEIKDENNSQNITSSQNIYQSSSTGLAQEDGIFGSQFSLSSRFPQGAINFKENSSTKQINNSGIQNNLQRQEGDNTLLQQMTSSIGGLINQQMINQNNGFNLNDLSYLFQQQQKSTLENALTANQQILSNSTASQNYFAQDNFFPQNSDPILQASVVSSSNLGGITSLNNLSDIQVSQNLNQHNQYGYNNTATPTTPYNTGLNMSQYIYASPFITNIGGNIMQTPFAFQQMASPSPFWTYSPYIPQQIPQFGNKQDQNFVLNSSNLASSTPAQVNLLSNISLYSNQPQQQQFYLPPPMQLLQEQTIEESNNLPCFAQSNIIQESSLLTAPSPIQKLNKENLSYQNLENQTQQVNQQSQQQQQTKPNQDIPLQLNDANIEVQNQNQDNNNKIIEESQNNNPKQNNNLSGSINIFKFLSSSRVSFGLNDTSSILCNQQRQDLNDDFKDQNENDTREKRISFSQPLFKQQSYDLSQKDQQKNQLQVEGIQQKKDQNKSKIFEEDDNLSELQQFKSQTQKKFVEFPSVPQTPIAANQNTPKDNNLFQQPFQIDNSNFQFTNSQTNTKKWVEFPQLTESTSKDQIKENQINLVQPSDNKPLISSKQTLNNFQSQSSNVNTQQINELQNIYSVKSVINQIENQSPSDSNDLNIQSNQNDSENASKSSQDQNNIPNTKAVSISGNLREQLQQNNKIEVESEEASQSPSKQDKETLQFTIQQKKHQQQIINQILKRRATLEIDDILGGDKQKQDNELTSRKKQHTEDQFETQKIQNTEITLFNQKKIQTLSQNNQEIEIEQDKQGKLEEQKEQNLEKIQSEKSQLDLESEKEKWCLLELLFLYYPKYCNDQTDKNLQKVIMIAFLDQIFRPLLVKFYSTYFDLIIETSKFEFYLWKICFQFFNESLESDFVINNTVMIEKVVKGVEEITQDFKTKNYGQTINKRKILETIVLAFLQQRNAKYYGRTNRKLLQLYLESMSQSNLMTHISFDHSCEYLNFEAILTRISQLINRNVRSIYHIDSQTFIHISQSILNQLNNFINGPLFIEFVLQFSVPSVQHLKKKDDGQDAEKIYPFFNNKVRIFLIYFAQFYVESTSPVASQVSSFTVSQQNLNSNQLQMQGSSRQSFTNIQANPSQYLGRLSFCSGTQLDSQNNSNNSQSVSPDNLGENFEFYTLIKQYLPNEYGSNESIDNLLINLTGYLTKVLYFVELKERNYDLNDPTAHLLAEEEGYDNPNSELTLLQLYKSSKLYDYDFSCLQFIFTLIPNNSLTLQAMWQAIQSLIIREKNTKQQQLHLFDLSVEKIISDPVCQLNVEYFLFTLCNICINSISLLNALSPNQKLQNVSWMKQSVEFAVIMSFFDKPLQDFYQVKENLKERFEINVQYLDLEGCVSKVAEWDENHKKFRLKKEFQNMFEPYYAERNRGLANDMYQTLKQQMQKDFQSDLILGNMLEFMETKRCHNEKKSKRNIFSSNQSLLLRNINFLQFLSKICENLQEISAINMNIAKHAVKLLQIIFIRSSIDRKNHQIINQNQDKSSQQGYNTQQAAMNNSSQQQQQSQQSVNGLLQEDLYLFRLFVSNQKIKEQLTNYSSGKEDDLKRSTKKIINIFNAFQDIYQKENSIILMQIRRRNSSVDEENKKSEIKNQQQRIMEEFRKKQQNFLQKSNSNNVNKLANNNLSSSVQTNQDLICSSQSISQIKQNDALRITSNPSFACLMDQNDEASNFQVSDINLHSSHDIYKAKRSNPPLPPECLICRTTSTERSAVLVIPCYLAPDNLFNYFLKESFCNARLQTVQQQDDANASNLDVIQNQIDLKKSKFSWSFTGCTHQVHSKCHLDAQQNLSIKKKARSNHENKLNLNESFCAHCKSLLNIRLINIEYFLNSYDFSNMIERLNNSPQLIRTESSQSLAAVQQAEAIKENKMNHNNQIDQNSSDKGLNNSRDNTKLANSNNTPQTGYLSLPEIIQEVTMIQEELVAPKSIRNQIREDIDEQCKQEIEDLFSQLRKEIEMVSAGEDLGTIFQKCAYFMSERYLNKDVISYIQKELPMSKSVILNFAVLLQQNPPSMMAIKYIKNRLIGKLQSMKNLNHLILRQLDKNDSIDEIFVEILIDVLYIGFLYDPLQQKTANSFSIYEEKGRQRPRDGFEWTFVIVTSLLKIIKMNVVIQVACLLQASTSSSFDQNPQQIIGFTNILESIKANSQFRASLFNMVRPFIQMLVCFLLTVFPFSQTQLELLQKNILLDEDEYVHYENILSKEFMTIDPIQTIQVTGGELFLKNFLEILQNKEIQAKLQQFFIHNPFREFKLVQLPLSYSDFHKAYFFRKCSQCNFFPKVKGSDLHICLICGEVLCSYKCAPKQQSNQPKKKQKLINNSELNKISMMQIEQEEIQNDIYDKFFSNLDSSDFDYDPGNLSRHAIQKHCGKSAFLNIQRTTYILIDFPKAIQFHTKVFANRIGIPFLTGKPLIDWNKYFIDKKLIDHITQIIQDRQLSQYIRHQLMIKQSENAPKTFNLMTQLP
ncbi:zinc finger protein (macronuclear) [Tetrahymena thermophila SB210]|uniref:E3 ubiquitin-protein ligase n=1 Tax=Tetrahymena thermophila (strain SB210) TaxID=312017 RepID=I7MIR5_TETTS|nr:zinc finger protein [Tetrahymena thermophila SB210]EAR94183.2 zinc finger protein [Tetrahymena thermophila SB210]|eukprot:XP_001014428.2 zinc finger protein [Tetrahymena thermophila SB210]